MANQKISDLSAASTLDLTELVALVQSATTKKATVAQILAKALLLANNLSDLANAGTARTNLGLGSAAVLESSAFDAAGAASAAQAASQPLDADLTAIAALATTSFGRGALTAADAAAYRTYIGAGTSSFGGAYSSLSGIPSTFAPSAHATSHKSGGSDAIKLDELASPTDVTTLNASTSAHGLLPKLDNSSSHFLNGQGGWTTPAGGGGVSIGDAIGSGTASYVLFVDTGPVLAQSIGMTFDSANKIFTVSASPFSAILSGAGPAGTFSDGTNTVYLATGSLVINVAVGMINVPGTSGNTYRWNASTTAPSTQTLLSLPLNVYGAGTITDLLGDPDGWVLVNINGTNYKLPAYL